MSRVQFKLKLRRKREPDFQIPDIEYHSYSPSDFDLKNNVIFLKNNPDNPFLRLTIDEILREAHYKEQGTMIVTEAFYDPCNEMFDSKTCRGNLSATYIFGVQGAEVEVDIETGKVKILNYVASHDVGKVLNQQTIRGQIYGGIVQGLGYALCEEYKTEKGKNLNPNFVDYKLFSALDVDFPIHIDLIETNDGEGPFGAKGVGEPGLVPVAPAIANAIYDAVGVRIYDLPITAEKLLSAIKAKEAGSDANHKK